MITADSLLRYQLPSFSGDSCTQLLDEPLGEPSPGSAMRGAEHAAHIHEAVNRAFAALILDWHAGCGERLPVILSLVAQGIVTRGNDQRRWKAGVVLV